MAGRRFLRGVEHDTTRALDNLLIVDNESNTLALGNITRLFNSRCDLLNLIRYSHAESLAVNMEAFSIPRVQVRITHTIFLLHGILARIAVSSYF
jgi:hypothetical protein